jgi:hypothetical protein
VLDKKSKRRKKRVATTNEYNTKSQAATSATAVVNG